MNWFKRIAIFGLLLTFLVGNIGFAIYTHSCSLSGTQQSFFVQSSDPCETLHNEAKTDSCCEEDNSSDEHTESISNDCCSTDAQYIKVANDLSPNSWIVKLVLANQFLIPDFGFSVNSIFVERISENENFVHPPPKYQGRKLQPLNQVFII